MGFEPTCEEPNGFQSIALTTRPFCLQKLYRNCISLCKFSIDKLYLLGKLQITIIKKIYLVLSGFLIVVVIMCANHSNVSDSSPGRITWLLFSTMSSAVFEEICSKVTSHPKHRTAGNSFFS